ncbi:DUF4349 domain-containing protein [Fontibacillus sp. BL9]|uniref:DUF4349 domain-containing protein n=1 Tax=Fontibacillus sp. BL9 TaxID=3389971 RepID=UPI00397BAC44
MKKCGFYALLLCLSLSLLLGGCGSAGNMNSADSGSYKSSSAANTAMSEDKADMSSELEAPAAESGAGANANLPSTESAAESDRASSGFQGSDSAAGLNKKLIYRANVAMKVKDYGKAQSEIRNLVTLTGGYIVEFSENQSQHERGGTFILKIPAAGFSSFLDRLEQLKPETIQQSIQGQDVSEEYVDLESRLKVKQAMEARYLKFVDEATQTSQLVEFVNELERIQTEIEQIKGRMRYINNNVSFSTIEIRLYQPVENSIVKLNEEKPPLYKRAQDALTGSIDVISLVLQWFVVVLSGALPLIAIGAVIAAVVWPLRRRRQKRNRFADWNAARSAEREASAPIKEIPDQATSPAATEQEDEDQK